MDILTSKPQQKDQHNYKIQYPGERSRGAGLLQYVTLSGLIPIYHVQFQCPVHTSKKLWRARDNVEVSYKTTKRVIFFRMRDGWFTKGRIIVYVCLLRQTKISKRQLLNLVRKGTGETREVETDFSNSQASGDALSGMHTSERLWRMKGNKQKVQTQWSHTIKYYA